MKKIIYRLLYVLPLFLIGCSQNDQWVEDSEGSLLLNVGIDAEYNVKSRAISTEDMELLKSTCRIRIFDGETLIRKYQGVSTLPQEGLQLMTGNNYSTRVVAGDSVAASFEKKFFEGVQSFEIVKGQTTPVNVVCKIQNTLAKVNFDPSLDEMFADYNFTVSTSKGSLVFNKENLGAIGYFILPQNSAILSWKFVGTTVAGTSYSTGKDESAAIATLYTFNCSFKEDPTQNGGGVIDLVVDSTPLEENTSDIVINQRPTFTILNEKNEKIDINIPTYLEIGVQNSLSLWVAASSPLVSVDINCSNFTNWELPFNRFDAISLNNDEKNHLNTLGLEIVHKFQIGIDGQSSKDNLGICMASVLMQKITQTEGTHSIFVTAVDQNNGSRTVEWRIVVSNATVVTQDVIPADVWSNKAVLRGTISRETQNEIIFRYREVGTSLWTNINAVRDGNALSAMVSGLTAGTKYEYLVVDGDAASSVVCSFTTETQRQLENNGFEEWQGSAPMLIYGKDKTMWWDSGNHGSATLSTDITTYDGTASNKHSGQYSAKLQSKFVSFLGIGKFAAGNIFVGKYLKTVGTSGGIIGWGREWNSRPIALRGWVKYNPGIVNYSSTNKIAKGDRDQGSMFIALGDWEGSIAEGEKWPVVVNNTSEAGLFDPSEANTGIIGYGEQTWYEAVGSEGMIEFTIPINYRTLDRKPTSIVIVASSSKYGDYFSGSTDSTMWLDDLELIYE